MSEEIMIDGVNVAECEFLQDGMCYVQKDNQGYTDIECSYDNYDCYYKQLKRLQAENEELKKFCIQLEKAKEKQHLQWQQRCTENHNEDSKLIKKYRKALEEIREYLQQFKKKKSNFYTLNDVVTDIANNIEKIINEVLDERD